MRTLHFSSCLQLRDTPSSSRSLPESSSKSTPIITTCASSVSSSLLPPPRVLASGAHRTKPRRNPGEGHDLRCKLYDDLVKLHRRVNPRPPPRDDEGHNSSDTLLCRETVSFDFLTPVFSNWYCVVTAILGCCPVPDPSLAKEENMEEEEEEGGYSGRVCHSSHRLCSVQKLDSFTTHLILNCSQKHINCITTTIIERINATLVDSDWCTVDVIDQNVHEVALDAISESNLPLVVGKRFLNSVVRVLAVEHSRVKNTFIEMQQMRGGRGGGGGGREGRGGEGGSGEGCRRQHP